MVTIYVIFVKNSNWVYVGSTINFVRRKTQHRSLLRAGKHHSDILQREVNKVGVNATTFECKETCSKESAGYRETVWLNKMAKTHDVCNLMRAGNHSHHRFGPPKIVEKYKWSDESRANRSAQYKGRKVKPLTAEQSAYMNSFPKPELTPERREQFAALGRAWGKQVRNIGTKEVYDSISKAAKAIGCSPGNLGRALSEGGRAMGHKWEYVAKPIYEGRKISDASKNALDEARKKFYRQVKNLNTGEVFESGAAAARAYSVSTQTIYSVCTGRTKTGGGCRWEYHSKPELFRKLRQQK